MTAIILAAGKGSRLQEVLQGKPKPLFEIGGKSLLEHSLDALHLAGIQETIIAIGFQADEIKKKIGKSYKKMKINYGLNNIHNNTGSMHSLYIALGKPQSCLVLDGDIIFHTDAIKRILQADKKDAVLLRKLSGSGDEVNVFMSSGRVISLGKNNLNHNSHEGIISIADSPAQNPDSRLEFTGISKFSQAFIEKMFELHEQNIRDSIFSEHCEYCACRAGAYIPWYGIIKKDLLWCEIDTPADIKRAQNVVALIKNKTGGKHDE